MSLHSLYASVRRRPLLAIIIVAVVARVAAALYLGNTVTDNPGVYDQISYHNLALRVIAGHGFSFGETWWPATAANEPTAHWSFIYTLYLALVYTVFGPYPVAARVIQAVIAGVLMPWLLFRIGRQLLPEAGDTTPITVWVNGRNLGLTAAAIGAVYIYFVYYAGALIT